ncbi:P-loop containing nucleoside triphosphate hydrolase [Phytophthora cactorum]|nr:P-loop containing nucleoside triphosphate hydrolase [Phytophthora cactorum]
MNERRVNAAQDAVIKVLVLGDAATGKTMYYKDALGALLVYDMSRPETFDSILKWKKEIDSKVELPNGKSLPVILCGNKCDLKEDVDRDFLDEFCNTNNFTGWFATSAKENIHIDDAAKALVTGILEHKDIFERKSEAKKRNDTFRPTSAANGGNANQSSWCCNSF